MADTTNAETESECGAANLLAGKTPSEGRIPGDAALITDEEVTPDGALWDGPAAAELGHGALTYDLGSPRRVSAVYLQADANDVYRITGSVDGSAGSYVTLADAPNLVEQGAGLRTRALEFPPVTVRYLRVAAGDGDGAFSISELAAYCQRPTPFPPVMRRVEAPMAAVARTAIEHPEAVVEPPPKSLVGWFEGLIAGGLLLVGWSQTPARKRARGRRAKEDAATPPEEPSPEARNQRFFPFLLVMFMASGCAALIYEIVWFQLLELVIGSSAVSIGVLLGTYMGGMCVGSLAFSRLVRPSVHPLRVYALLELGILGCGLAMLGLMPLVQNVYTAVVGLGAPGLLLRGLFAALCLLPPTVMMGATLPAASRWVVSGRRENSEEEASGGGSERADGASSAHATPAELAWLGYLYGANTLGAVIGCVLAGFLLLRVFDMPTATYVAAGLNAVVALAALGLARLTAQDPEPASSAGPARPEAPRTTREEWLVYATIGLSGMTALGAEVLWTRQFWLLLGGTTYTFSIILAVFLVGIGLGSTIGSSVARHTPDARRALGVTQLLSIGAIAWSAWNLARSLPYWPVNPTISPSTWFQFQVDIVRCLWAVLPAACLWGASFPLALAAVGPERGQDSGRLVGRVYAANTVGAIVGALGMSLGIIGWLGTQAGERILLASAALAAIVAFEPFAKRARSARYGFDRRPLVWSLVTLFAASFFIRHVAPIPPLLVGHGRTSAASFHDAETYLYVGEGLNSSLAVSRNRDGILSYHNAGKVQASTQPQDMRLQRMLGHLTTLVPESPKSVLVIACGAGVTAGAVSVDPRVERLTIAEIEPLVPGAASKYFAEYNHHVVTNPKTRVEIDDARHFLNTTRETFDAITSDPFDPWVKGAAALYTEEFWSLVKARLNRGGVATVFVQLYQAGTAAVKSEVATFFKVFPDGVIFANTVRGEGYDVVLVGQRDPRPIDVDKMTALLERPEFATVKRSLQQTGFNSAVALLSTYGSRGKDLGPWLADAEINRDRDLRLQFLAGFDLNANEAASIYRGILPYRRYPEGFFVGSSARLGALRAAMHRRWP